MTQRALTINWGDLFSLDIPPAWSWSDEDGVVAIFRSDGVGALQVSVLSREKTEQDPQAAAMQLALSFAREREWDVSDDEIRAFRIGDSSAAEFGLTERGDNPAYWQVWHLVGADRAAFITYTCDPDDSELEATERRRIVESFRWL
jgi:hypothetical protein